MNQPPGMLNPWAKLLLAGLLVQVPATASAADSPPPTRFSQSLATAERHAAGLDRLSSDEIAVIDALVRRDLATQSAPRRGEAPAGPGRFSQRLTADERRTAGFAVLTEAELLKIDRLADRNAASLLSRTLLAPPTFVPLSIRARVAEAKATGPEIHGSFTLGMSVGKGYSERFGGMTLTYEDPVRNFAVSFSYMESHVKGGGPYYLRDPLDDADRIPRFGPERGP